MIRDARHRDGEKGPGDGVDRTASASVYPLALGVFPLVIAGVGHHFAGFRRGGVQTVLRADITQDDRLQMRVEDIGERNPFGDQRRSLEVFANLDARQLQPLAIQRILGIGGVRR